MSQETVREQLERLRAEIAVLEAGHTEARERLDGLVSAIERQLEGAGDKAHGKTLRREILEFTDEFGLQHPNLTAVLDGIATALSNMGI